VDVVAVEDSEVVVNGDLSLYLLLDASLLFAIDVAMILFVVVGSTNAVAI
jgi:hypothetical protein